MERRIVCVAIDDEPVVHCNDCKYSELEGTYTDGTQKFCRYYCYYWDYEQGMSPNQVEENDYCSNGEKRED